MLNFINQNGGLIALIHVLIALIHVFVLIIGFVWINIKIGDR